MIRLSHYCSRHMPPWETQCLVSEQANAFLNKNKILFLNKDSVSQLNKTHVLCSNKKSILFPNKNHVLKQYIYQVCVHSCDARDMYEHDSATLHKLAVYLHQAESSTHIAFLFLKLSITPRCRVMIPYVG